MATLSKVILIFALLCSFSLFSLPFHLHLSLLHLSNICLSLQPTKNSDSVLPPEYRVGSTTLHEEAIVSSVLICVSRKMTVDKLLETIKTTFATETGIKVPNGSRLYVEGTIISRSSTCT